MNAEGRKVFILSPANMNGVRARLLFSARSNCAAARSFRSNGGMSIEDAFCFMSSLYFRGKLVYAKRFVSPFDTAIGPGILVIAPGFGLVSPDWKLDHERIHTLQRIGLDPKHSAYRKPFSEQAHALNCRLGKSGSAILLGSVATGKYVGVLGPIFGERLLAPRSFLGIGDMSRGALLLRAATGGQELEYIVVKAKTGRTYRR